MQEKKQVLEKLEIQYKELEIACKSLVNLQFKFSKEVSGIKNTLDNLKNIHRPFPENTWVAIDQVHLRTILNLSATIADKSKEAIKENVEQNNIAQNIATNLAHLTFFSPSERIDDRNKENAVYGNMQNIAYDIIGTILSIDPSQTLEKIAQKQSMGNTIVGIALNLATSDNPVTAKAIEESIRRLTMARKIEQALERMDIEDVAVTLTVLKNSPRPEDKKQKMGGNEEEQAINKEEQAAQAISLLKLANSPKSPSPKSWAEANQNKQSKSAAEMADNAPKSPKSLVQ